MKKNPNLMFVKSLKLFKHSLKYSVLILAIIGINSCNECPLVEAPPFYLCESRIVTLEKFNPNYTVTPGPTPDEPIIILDPDYNISMFEFPFDKRSTGQFPNDFRFKNNAQIPILSTPFIITDQKYYLAVMDTYPANSELIGDILVKDVNLDPLDTYSNVRVFGTIKKVFDNIPISENSQEFCDFVTAQTNTFEDTFKNITILNKYGQLEPNVIVNDYTTSPTVILNDKLEILGTLGTIGLPTPINNILDIFNQKKTESITYDLTVRTGEVYAYIARNGKRFVFVVTEMRQSIITPFRKRISIMFFNVDKS